MDDWIAASLRQRRLLHPAKFGYVVPKPLNAMEGIQSLHGSIHDVFWNNILKLKLRVCEK